MTAMTTVQTSRATQLGGGQALFGTRVDVPAPVAQAISVDEICDLIEAAGPLTLADIAGGLDRSLRQVSACVQRMVARRLLRRDEFRRYRLHGAGATH
jgi:hypothetical protein